MRNRHLAAIARRVRHFLILLQASRATRRRLGAAPIRRLLVVCYGNICRSAYLGMLAQQEIGTLIEVCSGGFHVVGGRETPQRHQALALQTGVDLSSHRSKTVTQLDLEWADTIVLMDRYNWDRLRQMNAAPHKLVWLGAVTGESVEISDPYELDDETARTVYRQLRRASDTLIELIRKRAELSDANVSHQ